MTIKTIFECGGCFKKEEGKIPQSRFVSLSGKSWGFGSYHQDSFSDVAPEGWIAFDPYTQCTYCPECWGEIEGTEPLTANNGG